MTDEVAKATAILNEIDQWEDIAAEFEKRGIKGFRADACACPVARYVRPQLLAEFSVSRTIYSVGLDNLDLRTPRRVGEFISDFDFGSYPELEAKYTDEGAYV